jgi:hypothetical protein
VTELLWLPRMADQALASGTNRQRAGVGSWHGKASSPPKASAPDRFARH